MPERRFGRNIESLGGIHDFVAGFVERQGLPGSICFDLDLVIEELFTNMVKYSPEGAPEISVGLERVDGAVEVVLRDFDVEPFDPTAAEDAEAERALAEHRRGGLGLRLVRRIADRVRYEYRDRTSTITLTVRAAG
jgi:serine/threonine-protein kinase RsbW